MFKGKMKAKTIFSRSIPFILIIFLFLFVLETGCTTKEPKTEIESKVNEYINAYLKMGKFSGSILIAQGGKVLVSKGYGMANYELGVPNTPQTKFRLGSITKQFTAMAIMQLQEQGKLDVNDAVSRYVEESPETWKEITIHHLLTHTSGIPSYTNFSNYVSLMTIPTNPKELIARFKDKPLEFAPGEKYRYSDSAYNLLGFIIENVSGKKYEEFLGENIFAPLGMTDTGHDDPIRIIKNRASGYNSIIYGGIVNAHYIHMSVPYAAGALYSTVEDLYKWDRSLYTEKLVSKQALDKIFTPFKNNYGYGWAIGEFNNHNRISHGGGVDGFTTNISRYVDDDVCIIVLNNIVGTPVRKISDDIAAIVFAENYELPEMKKRSIIEVDPRIYDDYVGQYEYAFIIRIIKENNHLFFEGGQGAKIEIYPESETKFFQEARDAQITFVKNKKGEVIHLILHQRGTATTCKKIN